MDYITVVQEIEDTTFLNSDECWVGFVKSGNNLATTQMTRKHALVYTCIMATSITTFRPFFVLQTAGY